MSFKEVKRTKLALEMGELVHHYCCLALRCRSVVVSDMIFKKTNGLWAGSRMCIPQW